MKSPSLLASVLFSLLAASLPSLGVSPPSGADKTISLAQGADYTISVSDWGFTDAGDSPADGFSLVKLTTLPGVGSLTVDGAAAVADQSVSVLSSAAGGSWVERTAAGSRVWWSVASSADGSKLAAVVSGGYIYTSTDAGVTWTEQTNSGSRLWNTIASSADGSRLAAAVNGGYVYTSIDGGQTWTERTNSGIRNWGTIASSADGERLAGAPGGAPIQTSADGGQTWTSRPGMGNPAWGGIASAPDGLKLAAATSNGFTYTTTDSGANWVYHMTDTPRNWSGIAISSDGNKVAAVGANGWIYTAINVGATWTWTPRLDDALRQWRGIASSTDGNRLAAVVGGGSIYTSTDAGVNWTVRMTDTARNWRAITSSADGSRLVAVVQSTASPGYIYTSEGVPSEVRYTAPTTAGSTSFTFQVQDNAVSGNLDLSPNTITFTVAPTVTASTVNLLASATSLTINGAGFDLTPANNTVAFSPTGTGTVTGSTATTLTVTGITGLTVGVLNAIVTTNGQASASTQVATVVSSPPTLTAVSPAFGRTHGRTPVTLTGTNFSGTPAVTFGGTAATSVTVVNATTLTAILPAHAAGYVDVSVTTPGGTATRSNGFIYYVGAFSNFMDATTVVGQANFTAQVATASQSVLGITSGAAISVTGKLAIADAANARVLIWNSIPTSNGVPADVVVGKANFTNTTGGTTASLLHVSVASVAFSPDGQKLIAADQLNNRVLIWNTVPTSNGVAADVVIGQTNFTSDTAGTSASKLWYPLGLLVTPDGKLLISERYNNRVLIYSTIPTTNGAAADVVIGQPDKMTATAGAGASQMFAPYALELMSDGRLLVGDSGNNRVLVFASIPMSDGAPASVVIGQTGFGLNIAATTQTGMTNPLGVTVSSTGRLAVADYTNHRVLIYDSVPTTNGAAASAVLGQPDFTSSVSFNGGVSARSMTRPYIPLFTADGRLLVPGDMRRVMIYGETFAPTIASVAPASGPAVGGTSIVITGTNFTGTTGVTIGGTAVTSYTVDSATQITATTAAHAAGASSVLVTTPAGTNPANTLFYYMAPPTVTLSSAALLATATTLTITGTSFDAVTPGNNTVVFNGGVTGTVTASTATTLTVTSLSTLTVGSLTAVVTTNGQSSGSAVQVAAVKPVVSPNTTTYNGGTTLLINGFGFDPLAANNTVLFSNGAVGTVTNATSTQLTVTLSTLPTSSGPLTVVVTTNGQSSVSAVQVATVIDYTVTTSGNAIVVTDVSGNGDTLTVSEVSFGNIQFAATGRTFSVDGGAAISSNSGIVPLASVTSVTVNAGGGADTINVGTFTFYLPGLTINGGPANDTIAFNGSIVFAANSSLEVTSSTGSDSISVASGVVLNASGTGTLAMAASNGITINSSTIVQTAAGALTLNSDSDADGTGTLTLAAGATVYGTTINFQAPSVSIDPAATVGKVSSVPATSTFASNALLSRSYSLAIDASGNVYSGADDVGGVVSKITPGGVVSTYASGPLISKNDGLVFDASGNLYVSSLNLNTITKVTPGGAQSTFASGAPLNQPDGLAIDASGNLYVANFGGNNVIKITPAGAMSVFASGLAGPNFLALDGIGNLYVSNQFGGSISKITSGGVVSMFATGFTQSYGLAFDRFGDLYVADFGAGDIKKVTPAGTVSTLVGIRGVGLVFDPAGNLYVARYNTDVTKIDGPIAITTQVTITPSVTGREIDVGTHTAGKLGLTDVELDRFLAGTLNIGDVTSGNITVSQPISPASAPLVNLLTGGSIKNTNSGTALTVANSTSSGTLAPGASPGLFAVAGNHSLIAGSTFFVELGGATAGTLYDQLSATGSVSIGANVALNLASFIGFVPLPGQDFVIINRTGGSGTFAGLAEGTTIASNFLGSGLPARITYVGGTGDDVVISTANPEIQVEQPTNTILVDGTASIDFGTIALSNSSAPITFTIRSVGSSALHSGAITFTGTDFSANTAGMSTAISPNGSTTFTVTFTPTIAGVRSAVMHIASDVNGSKNPFDIALTGKGFGPVPFTMDGQPRQIITNELASNATGMGDGTQFDALGRGAYLSPNGVLGLPGTLKVGVGGVTMSPNNFQAYWKDDGTGLKRLIRSGDAAPGTGGAVYNAIPTIPVPGLNSTGQVTLLAGLRIGTGSPSVTALDDTGMWSEVGGSGLQLLMRENDSVPGISGSLVSSFGFGCYATATTGVGAGEAAFTIKLRGDSSDTVLLRSTITSPTTASMQVLARENTPATGTSENFGFLSSTYTSAVRMDPQGNVVFAAQLKPSGRSGVWYQPRGGSVAKVFAAGDVAPGTSNATFQSFEIPSMGSNGVFAVRAFLNRNGDNSTNAANDGIWRGTSGALSPVLRRGDPALPGMPVGSKVGNPWTGWLNQANRGAWRAWVDTAGDGISPYPADTFGIFTDVGGTMRLLISSGDAAPGIAGTSLYFIDHPVVSGATAGSEHVAFLATLSGTGVVNGTNDKTLWRSANGGPPVLLLRTGTSMTTSQGTKTVADIDMPGSNMDIRPWEQTVMDNTGRLLIIVTFDDGYTSQIIIP